MIVRDEDLDVRNNMRFQATMDKIYDFIGLCPATNPKNSKPTLKGKAIITPYENDMSQEMYSRLTTFYRPFTSVLDKILMSNELFHYKRRLKQQKEQLKLYNIDNGNRDNIGIDISTSSANTPNIPPPPATPTTPTPTTRHIDLINFNNISHWIDHPPSNKLHTIKSVLNNTTISDEYRSKLHDLFVKPTWFESEDLIYAEYRQVKRVTSWKESIGNTYTTYLNAALERLDRLDRNNMGSKGKGVSNMGNMGSSGSGNQGSSLIKALIRSG